MVSGGDVTPATTSTRTISASWASSSGYAAIAWVPRTVASPEITIGGEVFNGSSLSGTVNISVQVVPGGASIARVRLGVSTNKNHVNNVDLTHVGGNVYEGSIDASAYTLGSKVWYYWIYDSLAQIITEQISVTIVEPPSRIWIGADHVTGLYYGDSAVSKAFIGEDAVF